MWIGLIGLLVVGAIVVSFATEDHEDPVAVEPVDTATFCQTASRFSSFDNIDLSQGGSEQLRGLAVVATQLGTLSPNKIEDDFSAVSDALRNVAVAVDAVPADDPNGLAVVTQKLDDELGAVSDQANQAADYIEHWCGPLASLGTAVPTLPDTGEQGDGGAADSSTSAPVSSDPAGGQPG
jgi:hypothetical protein